MIKRLIQLSLLLAGYLLFLAMTFPAKQAWGFIHKLVPVLQPSRIEGTIWDARIHDLRINNLFFHSAAASLNFLPLLAGRLSMDIRVKGRGVYSEFTVSASSSTVDIPGFNAKVSAAQLGRMLQPRQTLNGRIRINLSDLRYDLKKKFLQRAKGVITWSKASVNMGKEVPLGDIKATLQKRGTQLRLLVRNNDKKLKLNGTVVLRPGGLYSVNVKLSPTNLAGAELRQQIRLMGTSDQHGAIRIRWNGRI